MIAVLVCGSRDFADRDLMRRELPARCDLVIHGEASGADYYAGTTADARGLDSLGMPAQWKKHGRSAGPRRNAAMLRVLLALGECGYSVSVLAFPIGESRGTRGMIKLAEKAGVAVRVVESHGEG